MSEPATRDPEPSPLAALFAIDLRSLALFRIALGVLIVVDIATRARLLSAHYGDRGLVPLELAAADGRGLGPLAPHLWSGAPAWEALLFAVGAALAAMLMAGALTRLATAGLWLWLISLHQRNPTVLDGGDAVALLLLFWSMFLPLGARWSVDAGRGRDARVLSPASAALLLQPALVYVFAGLAKTHPAWRDGSALNLAFGQTLWLRPAGAWLQQQETLAAVLGVATPYIEVLAPLLLFSPLATRPLRAVGVVGLLAFQLGLALCLELWLFPLYASVALLAFAPPSLWGGPPPPILARGRGARAADAVVVGALALGTAAGAAPLLGRELAPPLAGLAERLSIDQTWPMYGMLHETETRVRTLGILADGARFDFATERDGAPFGPVAELLADYRGKAHLERFWGLDEAYPRAFARWLCRRWELEPGERPRLAGLELDLVRVPLRPRGGRGEPRITSLLRHSCA